MIICLWNYLYCRTTSSVYRAETNYSVTRYLFYFMSNLYDYLSMVLFVLPHYTICLQSRDGLLRYKVFYSTLCLIYMLICVWYYLYCRITSSVYRAETNYSITRYFILLIIIIWFFICLNYLHDKKSYFYKNNQSYHHSIMSIFI